MTDTPGRKVSIRFVDAKHVNAAELVSQVRDLLRERDRIAAREGRQTERRLALLADVRSNRVVVISAEPAEAEVMELIRTLDVSTGGETRNYRFRYISPQRIDKIARELTGASRSKGQYRSIIDVEAGLLIVTAPPEIHEQIEALQKDLDVPETDPEMKTVRFYKLMNTTASEVLATIRALGAAKGSLTALRSKADSVSRGPRGKGFQGPNLPPAGVGKELPKPPSYRPSSESESATPRETPVDSQQLDGTSPRDATVTADPNTNTIIVVASPKVQELYEHLVTALDKRRPQVMIEVTLITVDTSNNFSLGVELSKKKEMGGGDEALVFSAFGLSKIDLDTGIPTLTAGTGFNGVLLSPDTVHAVIRALSTSGRARVLSAPKVLVNDNATATLASISEAPFTSVNASDTVSTTSFAGYASAGTTITVTPHISEGDYLQLEYSVSLNSFEGEASDGIPPPRQSNEIDSKVTIPDGHVIVVGGLTRKDSSETVSKIPILGDLPFLEYLFSNRTIVDSQSTLFVFIRPVVLRDDKFEDLKHLSRRDMRQAKLPPEPTCPTSKPMVMR